MTAPEIDIDALLAGAGTVHEASANRLLFYHGVKIARERLMQNVARGERLDDDYSRAALDPWGRPA